MALWIRSCGIVAVLVCGLASVAAAQGPAAPPAPWTGSVAAGLAVTGGNTATTTTNLAFTLESDKTRSNVFRAEGLNLRASRDGDAIVDRTTLMAQDDIALTDRTYAFGRFQYLRDVFKSIDYLIAPGGGVGYKLVDSDVSTLTADIAGGLLIEKNPGLERRTNPSVTAGEKAMHKLSDTATLTQSLTALFNASDFSDVLVTFQAGIASDITPRMQLRVDFLDIYKNEPPSVLVQKNDTTLIMSFVFKF
jgi:putative salt-induced outer membrane protein YdiY